MLTRADQAHEDRMQRVMDRYRSADLRCMKQLFWRRLQRLHAQRSPAMVAHIEIGQGLPITEIPDARPPSTLIRLGSARLAFRRWQILGPLFWGQSDGW